MRVAFPTDEASAELVASRLRAAGIAARVDRGLFAAWQVGQRGQVTVLVDQAQARRAHELLGTTPHEAGPSERLLRYAIAAVAVVIGLGVAIIATLLLR